MISLCPSRSFAAGDELWLRAHQMTHAASRPHDVSGMSRVELTRARRELRASPWLMRPGPPASRRPNVICSRMFSGASWTATVTQGTRRITRRKMSRRPLGGSAVTQSGLAKFLSPRVP